MDTHNNDSNKIEISDELDNWFNDLDEKSIEIINQEIIPEEENEELSDQNEVPETKCICIDDIIKKNISELSSNELIQYQCSVAYFIQVLIEGSVNNKRDVEQDLENHEILNIIEYLEWISCASHILSKRIGQEFINYTDIIKKTPIHNKLDTNKPSIVRSSYNFCTKYTQCKNFYSKHEIPNCKEHHYVHSLLKYDVDSVIVFLKYIIGHQLKINKEELNNLYLSVKTICFVTRHMAKEISYIDYITKNNSETFHRNNPIELKRKTLSRKTGRNDNTFNGNGNGNDKINIRRNYSGRETNFETNRNKYRNDRSIYCGFKPSSRIAIGKPTESNNRYSILSEII